MGTWRSDRTRSVASGAGRATAFDAQPSRHSRDCGPGRTSGGLLALVAVACTLVVTTTPSASATQAPTVEPTAVTVAFTAAPTTAAPGTSFATQPVVTVTGSTAAVTLSLVAVTSGAAGVLSCDTPSVTPVNGVATFTGCSVDRGGKYTLNTTVGQATAVSATLTIAGPEFTAQPSVGVAGVAGVAWSGQPEVTLVDSAGAPITSPAKVALVIKPGTGTVGAKLTCTNNATASNPMDATAGVAAFVGCSIDRAGTGYRLYAASKVGEVIGDVVGTSALFDITAAPATKLAFSTQPVGGALGADFAEQPVVTLQDQFGNTDTSSSAQVTMAITASTGATGAVLSCTAKSVTATLGVATFAGCRIDTLASGYTLTATSGALAASISAPVSIVGGGATTIDFSTSPGNTTAGAPFTIQPTVRLADAGANTVPGTTTLSIKAGTGAAGAILACTANPGVSTSGAITFAGCSINLASPSGNPYRLVATTGSLSRESASFEIAAGSAASARFLTSPTGAVGGEEFTTAPTVEVRDEGGNLVAGSVTLAVAPGIGRAGAVLACTGGNPVNTVNGVATFSGCAIDQAGPDYRLLASVNAMRVITGSIDATASTTLTGVGTKFLTELTIGDRLTVSGETRTVTEISTDTSLTVDVATTDAEDDSAVDRLPAALIDTSSAFDVTVGVADHLAFTTAPGGGTGGTDFAVQPVVVVQDRGGNTIVDSLATIILQVTPNTGSGRLTCTSNTMRAAAGAALFAGCSIDKAGDRYTLTAIAGDLRGVSTEFAVTSGPAASLVFITQPGAAKPGAAFGSQPVVKVIDAGGNGVNPEGPVVISLTVGTGTLGAALTCATKSVTPTNGVASFSGCALNQAGGGFALTAKSGGLTAESLPFPVLIPVAADSLERAPTGAPAGQTFGGANYAVNPTSVINNVNTATGSLQYAVNDLTMMGVGMDLLLDRTYHSADTSGGSFGRGWTSIFDLSVTLNKAQTVATVRAEDGQQLVFTRSSQSAKFVAPPGARADLSCPDKTCTVTRWDGVSWTVTGSRLDNYLDANGEGLRFSYPTGAAATAAGCVAAPTMVCMVVGVGTSVKKVASNVVVTRIGGSITKVATPTRSVAYGYTAGLLTSVKDVRDQPWTYEYTANRLTMVRDPLNQPRLVVTYDDSGRVATASAKGGQRHTDDTYTYGPITSNTKSTTRVAKIGIGATATIGTYVDTYRNNVLIRQSLPTGATLQYSYDNRLNVIAIKDTTGFVQTRTYSATNDLLSQTTPISGTSAAVLVYTYDNVHRMTSETDANGNKTTYGYEGKNLGSIVSAGPSVALTKLTYNDRGQLITTTTPIGIQSYTYDTAGNELAVFEKELNGAPINGKGTLATYDEAGNRTSFTDARGTSGTTPSAFTTQWEYDAAGNLLRTVDPLGVETSFTYDRAGDIASSTTLDGTTNFSWNENTLTRTTITPTGSSTQQFDPSGNLLKEGSSSSGYTTHRYDSFGREVATTDPSGAVTRYTYDAAGNVVLGVSDNVTLRRQFDALSRMIRSATDSSVSLTRYDLVGNTTQTGDGTGAVTNFTYDSHNKMKSMTDAAGTTSYQYDIGDSVTTRTDGRGGVTTYTYNGMRRVTSMSVDGKTTTYAYDEKGNVVTTTDPSGRVTTLTLDGRDRTILTRYQQGSEEIVVGQTFDWRNRRTSMTDSTGTHLYDYDAAGRLISAGTAGGTFDYDYSKPGIITETYPDSTTVEYSLDDAGALMGVDATSAAGSVTATYIRNLDRQTTGVTFSNGVLESRGYDGAGNVVAQSVQRFGTVLAGDTYTYDANGNRLTQRTTGAGRSVANAYAYDATGQIRGFSSTETAVPAPSPVATVGSPAEPISDATSPLVAPASFDLPTPQPDGTPSEPIGPAAANWTYDAVGNRTSNGVATTQYGAGDRITASPGTWTYDDSGAVTGIADATGTRTFSYDAAARLVRATVVANGGGSSTIEYTYDGDGNRISRTVDGVLTKYTWDPVGTLPMLVLERDASNDVQRRYFYGEGPVAMQTPTNTFYLHLDPLGSTNQVTDQSGAVVAAFNYGAFGTVSEAGTADAGQIDLLFQAQQFDRATGLYNMRARNYDPSSGRFTQREPMATPVGVPMVSAYSFVANRPTVYTDPEGLASRPSELKPQVTPAADEAFDAQMSLKTTELSIKISGKLTAYVATIGKTAAQVSSASATAAAKASAAKVKAAGLGLAIIGIGVQTYIAYERCTNGPVEDCVAATVSLVISAGFTVGCAFITSGIGAAACGIVGAMLSVALDFVISEYGPEIAAAAIVAYEAVAAGLTTAAAATLEAFQVAGDAITAEYDRAVANIISDFNTASVAITSGYEAALAGLVDAGYQAEQIANLLRDSFDMAARDTVAALVNFGYDVQAAVEALANSFLLGATEAAQLLKDGFNATATEVASALENAYNTTAAEAAAILRSAEYAVSEVATALTGAYELAAGEVAGFMQDAGFQFNQIAAALTDGLNLAFAELDAALRDVPHTLIQLAGAIKNLYDLSSAAAAEALKAVGYAADEVASALKGAYTEAAAAVAKILEDAGYLAAEVADALKDAYGATAAAVTQFLKDAGYLINDIGFALKDVFATTAAEVTAYFDNVGYSVVAIAGALKTAFTQTAVQAAQLLKDIGSLASEVATALNSAYTAAAAVVAGLLRDAGYLAAEVAAGLSVAFNASADAVIGFMRDAYYVVAEIATALQGAFSLVGSEVAVLLDAAGYLVAEIGSVLSSVFNQAAAEAAAVLQSIGAAASEISTALTTTFGQTTAAIGSLLVGLGFTSDVISSIGGAFTDFGNAVEDFFSDLF